MEKDNGSHAVGRHIPRSCEPENGTVYQQSLVQLAWRYDWSTAHPHEEERPREGVTRVSKCLAALSEHRLNSSQSFAWICIRHVPNTPFDGCHATNSISRSDRTRHAQSSTISIHMCKRSGYLEIGFFPILLFPSFTHLHRELDCIHGVMDQSIIGTGTISNHCICIHTYPGW